jgi:uncharacterized protein DUF4388
VPTSDPTFRGRLKALSIADILVFLKSLNRPGRLELRHGSVEVVLDLRGEFVVRAASNHPGDRLEAILLATGCITAAQQEQARAFEAANPEAGIGRALIACGALGPRDLIEARREQGRRIVQGLFEWTDGEYVFEERRSPSGWSTPIDLPILDLVAQSLRRVSDPDLFRARIPSVDWTFEPVPGGGVVRLQPQEEHVLALLDGGRTVGELEAGAEYPEAETRRILFLLLTLGRIRPRPQAATPDEEPDPAAIETIVRQFNGLYGRVYQYMTLELGPVSEDLLAASLRDLEQSSPPLFRRARLAGDGTLDEGILGDNVRALSRGRRRDALVQGLNELLYRELLILRQTLGPEHEQRVLHELRRDGLLSLAKPERVL